MVPPLRLLIAAVLLAVPWLVLGSASAYACSCALPSDDPTVVERADVVFVGSVVDNQTSGDTRTLTFAVDRVYKGEAAAVQRLQTHVQSATCGLDLVGPGPFVVQATGTSDDLRADLCGGTRPGPAPAALGPGTAPRPGAAGRSPTRVSASRPEVVLGAAVALGLAVTAAVVLRRRRSARPKR